MTISKLLLCCLFPNLGEKFTIELRLPFNDFDKALNKETMLAAIH